MVNTQHNVQVVRHGMLLTSVTPIKSTQKARTERREPDPSRDCPLPPGRPAHGQVPTAHGTLGLSAALSAPEVTCFLKAPPLRSPCLDWKLWGAGTAGLRPSPQQPARCLVRCKCHMDIWE